MFNSVGDSTQYAYDVLNQLTAIQDPLGQVTQYQYDALNRLLGSSNALGGQSSQEFDAVGNRTAFTDPNGNTTQFTYDGDGRLLSTVLASGDQIEYRYDERGLLASLTNARGQTRTFHYDVNGQLSQFVDGDGQVQLEYDPNGNLTKTIGANGTLTRTYDKLNRVESYIDSAGNELWFYYDKLGNLFGLTYPDGRTVYYAYDNLNRLTRVHDFDNRTTRYHYDGANRLTRIEHSNGTEHLRSYDSAGRLIHLHTLAANGETIAEYQFSYDAAGNIVQETVTPDITQLTDSLPLMNYGFANRLGSVDGQAAEFDGDGNMVKAPNGETLRFDTRNRLVEYGGIEYVFNAENHRVGMRTAEGLTQYVVNPVPALSQTLVKTEPDGSQTYYVYGLGLVSEHGPQGYPTYHYDLRGSTVALSDEQGAVVERFVYSPFGGLVSGDISATPFLYNGRDGVITDANGLYHMRARFYSPELRRFVNQDVLLGFVAEGQTLNRYAYVQGDPVKYIDPFGLDRLCGGGMRAVPCPDQPNVYTCEKDGREPEKVCASAECLLRDAARGGNDDGPRPYGGGGVFTDIHFLLFSIGGEHSFIRANNKTCRFATYCAGIGPGLYAGTGATIPFGISMGDIEDNLSGFSGGLSLDFSPSLCGVVGGLGANIGLSEDGLTSIGSSKGMGRLGGGCGFALSLEGCVTTTRVCNY